MKIQIEIPVVSDEKEIVVMDGEGPISGARAEVLDAAEGELWLEVELP